MNDIKKELTMTREFDAPRDLVFKAWTDPKLVKQWWGPNGVFIPTCELDVRVGGKMYIVMEAGEELGSFKGTQWPMNGEYEEITAPSKLVFTANAINNGKEILQHRTTVTFEEAGNPPSHEASHNAKAMRDRSEGHRTKMTVHIMVTKVMPGGEFAIRGMEQGWNQQLDKLVKFVAAMK